MPSHAVRRAGIPKGRAPRPIGLWLLLGFVLGSTHALAPHGLARGRGRTRPTKASREVQPRRLRVLALCSRVVDPKAQTKAQATPPGRTKGALLAYLETRPDPQGLGFAAQDLVFVRVSDGKEGGRFPLLPPGYLARLRRRGLAPFYELELQEARGRVDAALARAGCLKGQDLPGPTEAQAEGTEPTHLWVDWTRGSKGIHLRLTRVPGPNAEGQSQGQRAAPRVLAERRLSTPQGSERGGTLRSLVPQGVQGLRHWPALRLVAGAFRFAWPGLPLPTAPPERVHDRALVLTY